MKTLTEILKTATSYAESAETAEGNALSSYNKANEVKQNQFTTAMIDLVNKLKLADDAMKCAQAAFNTAKDLRFTTE